MLQEKNDGTSAQGATIFGWAAITSSIGPQSSVFFLFHQMLVFELSVHAHHVRLCIYLFTYLFLHLFLSLFFLCVFLA